MSNDKTLNYDFSTPEKDFCCIKMKRVIQENIWIKSGAKNFDEYIDYVKKVAEKHVFEKK
jgi:hypothetical protein